MRYSAYKLNKQGDNIQPWRTPFPIWNQSVVSHPVLTVASWPAYRFLGRQVKWSCIPISLRIFQFVSDPHSQRLADGLVAKSYPILVTPWTVAYQARLFMGFSRWQYWSGLPFPSPDDLSNPKIEPVVSCISGRFCNEAEVDVNSSSSWTWYIFPSVYVNFNLFYQCLIDFYIQIFCLLN